MSGQFWADLRESLGDPEFRRAWEASIAEAETGDAATTWATAEETNDG